MFKAVASAFASGKAGGEYHAVVSQCGGWDTMGCNCFTELGQHDGAGDAPMGGGRERVAGVVVDPVEYFYVGVIGEPPVGEVGLPALVGLFGGKADVGGFGAFVRLGVDVAAARRWRWMELTDTTRP